MCIPWTCTAIFCSSFSSWKEEEEASESGCDVPKYVVKSTFGSVLPVSSTLDGLHPELHVCASYTVLPSRSYILQTTTVWCDVRATMPSWFCHFSWIMKGFSHRERKAFGRVSSPSISPWGLLIPSALPAPRPGSWSHPVMDGPLVGCVIALCWKLHLQQRVGKKRAWVASKMTVLHLNKSFVR